MILMWSVLLSVASATPSNPGRVHAAERARMWAQQRAAAPAQVAPSPSAQQTPQIQSVDGMMWIDEPAPAAVAPMPQPVREPIEDLEGGLHHLPPTD
ncbi:MAG: hypothetical protein AAFV53_26670 [Myxococcota bacterium]